MYLSVNTSKSVLPHNLYGIINPSISFPYCVLELKGFSFMQCSYQVERGHFCHTLGAVQIYKYSVFNLISPSFPGEVEVDGA